MKIDNQLIAAHQKKLRDCTKCEHMIGPVVTGKPILSPVLLIGQAPGEKEGPLEKPFAWTAGKTLFGWFKDIGLDEAKFRNRIYMSAVCRCFPGKNPKGGDRVPSKTEITNCSPWLETELKLLQPRLILPVGRLAINQFLKVYRLNTIIGQIYPIKHGNVHTDIVALPHPSGASTWYKTEPGKTLLTKALQIIKNHPAWQDVCRPR